MLDPEDRLVSEIYSTIEAYGINDIISSVSTASDKKIKIVPKKRFWFLKPTIIRGSSVENVVNKMKSAIADGSFWTLDEEGITDLIIEKLTDQIGWLSDIHADLLTPAFGEMGECLYNILYGNMDDFLMRETRSMIKRHLAFVGWDGMSIMLKLYDMSFALTVKRDILLLHDNQSALKVHACREIEEDYHQAMQMLKDYGYEPNRIDFAWSKDYELIQIFAYYPDAIYNVKISDAGMDCAMSELADSIIQERTDYDRQESDFNRKEQEEEEHRINAIISDSKIYGDLLVADILNTIHISSRGYRHLNHLQKETEDRIPTVHKNIFMPAIQNMEDEGLISVFDDNGRDAVEIIDDKLACAFMHPQALQYPNDDTTAYTDTDWDRYIKDMTGSIDDLNIWVQSLGMLDHPILLYLRSDEITKFYETAPQKVHSYIEIRADLEEDEALKDAFLKISPNDSMMHA